MATNFEFYKHRLKAKFGKAYVRSCAVESIEEAIGVDIHEGCKKITCADCILHAIEWLSTEHIEQPKLTKRERAFCEAVQTGWIARDFDYYLYLYDSIPHKVEEEKRWDLHENDENSWYDLPTQIESAFTFIKWEDEKPWSVEDLLKLEVEE